MHGSVPGPSPATCMHTPVYRSSAHGEVVATKHAGAPFDPDNHRLPVYMKATRRAAPMEDVLM